MTKGAQNLVRQLLDSPTTPLTTIGTVVAVSPGVTTVRFYGSTLDLIRGRSYTPVVGHQVLLLRAGGTWVVLDGLTDFPT